jgi:hypothetical protein
MAQILSFFPGQQVTIFLETKDDAGTRLDIASLPVVSRVIFPSLTLAANYPQDMIQLDTGLYYYQFTLPTGASSVGSYLVDVTYNHPVSQAVNSEIYHIIVLAPFGNFSASVSV